MGRNIDLEKRNVKRLIVGIVISAIFFVLLLYINRGNIEAEKLVFLGYNIPVNTIQCSLMIAQILLSVLMVITVRKGGIIVSAFLLCASVTLSVLHIVHSNSLKDINGIILPVFGLIITFVVYTFVQKVENNEKMLSDIIDTDELTDLPNRHALINQLQYKVDNGDKFALLLIDIDNFKTINDTVGHNNGDELLKQFAEQWREYKARPNDYFARIGGDEFVLLVDVDNNRDEIVKEVEKSVYGSQFKHDFVTGDVHFYITASIGIAFYPTDGDTTSKLMQCADMALYMAKDMGKQGVCVFDKAFGDNIYDSVSIENAIRRAFEKDLFFLNYQPQFNVNSKSLRGFETLVRMKTESGKVLNPGMFIPIAEKSNLISRIDGWVLDHALQQFKPLINNKPDMILSVNVSVKYLFQEQFIDNVKNSLKRNDFPAKNLEIEITESVFIASIERAVDTLKKLKDMGIHIALDDFGTGYASLSYINSLPIDLLKIDKAFIDKLSDEEEENAFVEAIINMGHTLNLEVVSEGVEEESQVKKLDNFKCDYIQGYLWGKPMPYESVCTLLHKGVSINDAKLDLQ